MAEFDPQAYLSVDNETTSGFDPNAYLTQDVSQQPVDVFDPQAYIASVDSSELFTTPTEPASYNPTAPKGTIFNENNTALQNAINLAPSDTQIKDADEFFDTRVDDYFKAVADYKNKQKEIDNFYRFNARYRGGKPIGGKSNSEANLKYGDYVKKRELLREQLQELKENAYGKLKPFTAGELDKNVVIDYFKKAKSDLQRIEDPKDPTKTIKNPNKVTKQQVIERAKEIYLEDKKVELFQQNVYDEVDKMIKEQSPIKSLVKPFPEDQVNEIKKAKAELSSLEENNQNQINYLNALGNNVIGINNQLQLLNDSFEDKSEYFKGINENSDPAKIEEFRKYLIEQENYQLRFSELAERRTIAVNAYTDKNKNYTDKIAPKILKDYDKLSGYLHHMEKNGHLLSGLSLSLYASGGEILNNLEQNFAEVIMLPQGFEDDKEIFGSTKMAKTVKSWANNFEEWRGDAYKKAITTHLANVRNHIQEPPTFEEAGDGFGSAIEWGAFATANYLPQLAAMWFSGPRALGVLAGSASGGSFATSRQSNQLGETDYSLQQRWSHAGLAFGGEYVTERFSLGLINRSKGLFKQRAKEEFGDYMRRVLAPKELLRTGYRGTGEGVSEVGAKIIGENAADRFVFRKNVSLYEGVDEAFVTGLLMERTIAAPGIAKGILSPFTGQQFDQKLKSLQNQKTKIEQELKNDNLSSKVKDNLRKEYLDLQQKQDDIIKKQHENVDMLSEDEVQDLIDIDVEIYRLKEAQDNVMKDNSLSETQKQEMIERHKSNESELNLQKNKILQTVESDETRAKREEDKKAREKKFEKLTNQIEDRIRKDNEKIGEEKGKIKQFETLQEQEDYFKKIVARGNKQDKDSMESYSAMLNENLTRKDRRTVKKEIKLLNKKIASNNAFAKSAATSHGFISQKTDGTYEIFVNKENAIATDGNINVAAHEFLHRVLYQTTKGDSKLQTTLGNAVIDYIKNAKGGFSQKFIDKMEPYQGDANFGEEIITVMSDSIADGSLKYKEGFFTKVGDIIRQNLQRLGVPGFKNIKFNTGKDVYNFIKDYNASIEKGYNSKAIDRMMATEASFD